MDSRIETQQGPAGIRGFLPSQVSTSLELSFVARDKIEKLKPGKGIRNDIPVTEAEGPGLEEMSKKQEKKAALSGQFSGRDRWGREVTGLQRFYRNLSETSRQN